ncbi:MAG: alpha-E domain-containing protein [Sandaracinus sp.]|nr:alpha-E domain-containing protein [Sandaracinus sp.]MCB9613857.1 alpha-E domain-containing protein [Sandaracinus sp.]MCB9623180.1 alpha-E domain-containing protein [Sandaracinus sp.]MCB9636385.1 alpha-E domain-containing protein [Sandaracinus sp.]
MISRVAGCCFWLHRYVERAENLARLLKVNRSFLLDVPEGVADRWHPLIIVSGEQERFAELYPPSAGDDGEVVEAYLTWEERSPVSVITSLRWARENARTTREVISLEMWETLNDLWVDISRGKARKRYDADRDNFYKRLRDGCDLFLGLSEQTLLDDEPLDFMRLGMWLERASQTARMLDVKHHTLGPSRADRESPVELAQWSALLYSCSASEAYYKRVPSKPDGRSIAAFLLQDPALPRSVIGCLLRARATLERIRQVGRPELGDTPAALLDGLIERLRTRDIESIFADSIHDELTHAIDTTSAICAAIDRAYVDPGDQSALVV